MRLLKSFLVTLVILFPFPCHSEIALIGNDKISINMPRGYCHLVDSNPSDRRLIQMLGDASRNLNLVLFVFADCEQLNSWRQGIKPSLDDFGYVLSPLSLANEKLKVSLKNYLLEMRKIMNKQYVDTQLEEHTNKVAVLIKKRIPSVELNQTKNLGIISEDNKALYMAILQNVTPENGEAKNMLGLMGMTLVNGKTVNLYLWKRYTGDRSALELELLIKSWVADVHR